MPFGLVQGGINMKVIFILEENKVCDGAIEMVIIIGQHCNNDSISVKYFRLIM